MALVTPRRWLIALAIIVHAAAPSAHAAGEDADTPTWTEWLDTLRGTAESPESTGPKVFPPRQAPLPTSLWTALADDLLAPAQEQRMAARATLRDAAFAVGSDVESQAAAAQALRDLDARLAGAAAPRATPSRPGPGSGIARLYATIARLADAQAAHGGRDMRRIEARRAVIEAMGHAAPASEARRLLPYLRDPDLADAALDALLGMQGPAADAALIAALDESAGAARLRCISAIGLRGAAEAAPRLEAIADRGGAVGDAARMALARMGQAHDGADANAQLVAARAALEAGQRGEAERIYARFTTLDADTRQLRAALNGLAELGSDRLVPFALGYLNTPGVRAAALAALAADPRPGTNEALAAAYRQSSPLSRAALLEALDRRGHAGLPGLLDQALNADAPELRFTAARLAGLPPHPPDLLALAYRGPWWIQRDAMRAYLDRAHADAIQGEADEAAERFRTVVEGGFPQAMQEEAFEAIGHLGRERDLHWLERWSGDPTIGHAAAAARARVLRAQSDFDALETLAMETPHETAAMAAVEALADTGADTRAHAMRRGFLTQWDLLGPLPPPAEGAPMEHAYFDETRHPVPELIELDDESLVGWRYADLAGLPAIMDLDGNGVVYAHARIALPRFATARVAIGANGAYALWVNGERVHERSGERPFQLDEDRITVTLRPGFNAFLLKLSPPAGPWRFSVRLTDRMGTPIDLTDQELPDGGARGVGLRPGAVTGVGDAQP